jgi:ubiquinone/menaquinone biosynthesis C-methylase UbiE
MEETTGQVTRSAADVYEELFVPALFAEWAPRLLDAVHIEPQSRVLDVACGTGVVAREARRRLGAGGAVVGLDRNAGMLEVARRAAPDVEWTRAQAEALPFDDQSFDAVFCQFGLMFFEDRAGALREMWRVLRPGASLAVAVWAPLEQNSGYADMARLLERLFGAQVAAELKAPFALGDPETLRSLFLKAGIDRMAIRTAPGTARFPSLGEWVHTDVKGWTLADLIDDAQYETLKHEVETGFRRYVRDDGRVEFSVAAHIAIAVR